MVDPHAVNRLYTQLLWKSWKKRAGTNEDRDSPGSVRFCAAGERRRYNIDREKFRVLQFTMSAGVYNIQLTFTINIDVANQNDRWSQRIIPIAYISRVQTSAGLK